METTAKTQQKAIMESYNLTEEELNQAAAAFAREKEAQQNREEYYQKITHTPVLEIPTYDQYLPYLKAQYRALNKDRELEINSTNKEVTKSVIRYFLGLECGLDLDKGLLIQGPVGCGKTSLLRAIQHTRIRPFGYVKCKQLEAEYDTNGFGSIERFCEVKLDNLKRDSGWMYDDLGWEDRGKHYGKDVNVMEEVLSRVEDTRKYNCFYITTNLSIEKLKDKYGDRIMSRMRMMFNQVAFPPNAKDMRK